MPTGPNDRRYASIEFLKDLIMQGRRVLWIHETPIDRSKVFERVYQELWWDRQSVQRDKSGIWVDGAGKFVSQNARTLKTIEYEQVHYHHILTHPSMFNHPTHESYLAGLKKLCDRAMENNRRVLVMVREEHKIKPVLKQLLRVVNSDFHEIVGDTVVSTVGGIGKLRVVDFPSSRFVLDKSHKNRKSTILFSYVLTDHSVWRRALENHD